MAKEERKVLWAPQAGPQTEFCRRAEDVALYGGAKGGGKSEALLHEGLRQVHIPGYHALILRRTYPQLQELIDRAKGEFPQYGAKWSEKLHRFEFPSGAVYTFGHCQNEADKENYQGHEYHYIAFDQLEQWFKSQYDFISMANRSSNAAIKCYIRSSANPGGVGHRWVRRMFIDGKKPFETYTSSVIMTGVLGRTKKIERTSCFIPAKVFDNQILLKANPGYLANLYNLPEAEKKAYLDGDWDALSVGSIFDKVGLVEQEKKIEEHKWRGYLKDMRDYIQPISNEYGELKMWDNPQPGDQYVIGADPKQGDSGGDPCSAHVVNRRTWEVVATWHGWKDAFSFAQVLYNLGYYYNTAEIVVENNLEACVRKLQELGYSYLYRNEQKKIGFNTNEKTRNYLIATLQMVIRENTGTIRDRETLDEFHDFVRDEKTNKIAARHDCHDDRVMSLGIAWQAIRVNPFYKPSPREQKAAITVGYYGKPRVWRRRRSGM